MPGIDDIEAQMAIALNVPPVNSGIPPVFPVYSQFAPSDPGRIKLTITNDSGDNLMLATSPNASLSTSYLVWPGQTYQFTIEEDPDSVGSAWYWSSRAGTGTVRWREVMLR